MQIVEDLNKNIKKLKKSIQTSKQMYEHVNNTTVKGFLQTSVLCNGVVFSVSFLKILQKFHESHGLIAEALQLVPCLG